MTPQPEIAHYRITSKLGEGGMGVVWRATDTKLGREVAIKVLPEAVAADSDRLARFTREAQVLASLNHPNIAQIYGVEEGALVMELVEGPTLAERIAKGPIPLEEALEIAWQIGAALETAHEKGIVHRDLKPANIKLTADERVKVLDFGLAKAISGEVLPGNSVNSPTLTMRATVAGMILGTAGYMAPEQARGKPVDKRADIWAFGAVLYEMVTGQEPFSGETVSDTLAAVLTREPDLQSAPPRVRRLLRSCLEKDPRRRLRDIGDASRLLEDTPRGPGLAAARPVKWMIAAGLMTVAAAALALVHFRESSATAPMVRFTVAPPQKGAFGAGMALSPDGRHLAFPARAADGNWRVWVRSLDSLELRPLAGTEGTGTPSVFWSHDSRFVVFQAAGKVRKIDIAGGPPQSLCDSANTILGGSWNADGVILFGNNDRAILRVSSTGGAPWPVTRVEPGRFEIFHSDPIFLPDGRHFLYFRHSTRSENQGLYAGSLDAKPEQQSLQRILAMDFSPGYAPPRGPGSSGHLLFLREGSLMAQPFDERRLELSGEAVPVAEQVGTNLTRAFFSVSAAGGLAWRSGEGAILTQFAWQDREGRPLGHVGEPGQHYDLALSPDASRIAYTRTGDAGRPQIWILDLTRGIETRFSFLPGGASSPAWSPDGRYVAFSGSNGSGLFVKDLSNSSDATLLSRPGSSATIDQWSPDGRFLIYTVGGRGFDIFALQNPLGAGERTPVPVANSDNNESRGQVSPDSRWVTYNSNETGRSEVYVRPFPPDDGRNGKWLVSSNGGFQPRWRGDGKELYYVGLGDQKIMAVSVKTGPTFESATPQALFTSAGAIGGNVLYHYDVTRDGKRFLTATPVEGAAYSPITVTLNWEAVLKK